MMKKNILKYVLLSMTFFLGACNDFFNVETKNVLDHDGYITEESEMYSGYIGIMTKVQAIMSLSLGTKDISSEADLINLVGIIRS